MIAKRENITKEGVYSYKPYRKEQTVIGSCDKTEPFCKMTLTDILGLLTDLTVKGVVPGTAAQSVEGVPGTHKALGSISSRAKQQNQTK